jgi:hypothetical protein
MGLLNLFHHEESQETGKRLPRGFTMGIQDLFHLKDSANLVVVGSVIGTVRKGDPVYVYNFSDEASAPVLSTVIGIETGPRQQVSIASDRNVGLCIESRPGMNVKLGTMLYTDEITVKQLHEAYVGALTEVYAGDPDSFFRPDREEALSVTDCQELLLLCTERKTDDPLQHTRTAHALQLLCRKLLACRRIFCVFSKATGEPNIFSNVYSDEKNYGCTHPAVTLLTEPYHSVLAGKFPTDRFEIREISGREIEDLLGTSFYLNGAIGITVNYDSVYLPAEMLVPKPDFSSTPEISRPVMNPDLERWLLLMAQLGEPDTDDKKKIYQLYVSFLERELLKAKLLVPMKHEGTIPPADQDGKTVLQEGIRLSLATAEGKYGRPAVRMFTDWKRLKEGMGDGWEGMIETVGGMIDRLDCAVNYTGREHQAAGCYIGRDFYESFAKQDPGKPE